MNITLLVGTIYILIAVANYIIFIPEELKKTTTFISFLGFLVFSGASEKKIQMEAEEEKKMDKNKANKLTRIVSSKL